jgi:hypothetical protein
VDIAVWGHYKPPARQPLGPFRDAQVAQLVEHATENRSVGGSIPPLGTKTTLFHAGARSCTIVRSRHPWVGGPRHLTVYLATLECATSNPSLSSSPWMRGTPKWILPAHPPDQDAQLRVDLRSSSQWARLPTPVAAKSSSVPTDDRLRPDDCDTVLSLQRCLRSPSTTRADQFSLHRLSISREHNRLSAVSITGSSRMARRIWLSDEAQPANRRLCDLKVARRCRAQRRCCAMPKRPAANLKSPGLSHLIRQ